MNNEILIAQMKNETSIIIAVIIVGGMIALAFVITKQN